MNERIPEVIRKNNSRQLPGGADPAVMIQYLINHALGILKLQYGGFDVAPTFYQVLQSHETFNEEESVDLRKFPDDELKPLAMSLSALVGMVKPDYFLSFAQKTIDDNKNNMQEFKTPY